MRSKRELIEKFNDEHMPHVSGNQTIESAFDSFWNEEKSKAITTICETEGLNAGAFKAMIESYHFSGKQPLQGAVVEALDEKPKILERKSVVERIVSQLMNLSSTF